ncbi:fatty acid hydroxylase [Mucidula mucida]|nr:fatty acid hydroxylase [Mucidula mucida]
MTTPIPQPPYIPFLGNIAVLDRELPTRGYHNLSQQYGEIYQLNLVGRVVVFASSYALVNELSDDTRFRKSVGGALKETRNLVNDGIFTAFNDEPSWAIAHRLLMPAFGAVPIRDMFEDMRDITEQLILKWERFGPNLAIDPTDDLTRVALDTIALCSMSYRLNSFYTATQPAFVSAMMDFLRECNLRANRPSILQVFMKNTNDKYAANIKLLRETADQIVAERRRYPSDKKDILNSMLQDKDLKTGQKMSDKSITDNLLTFLIAGHETTSGVLCFVLYYLIKYPDVMQKLRNEVDKILGDLPAQMSDFPKMPYLNAVLRETMRLQPTAAIRVVYPLEDTTLGRGKYFVKAGQPIALQIWDSHRDTDVWGNDAETFRPERMMDGGFESAPRNAWQPFGYGLRGCIGRPFSWQEMSLVITSIVQRLDLQLVDPNYELEIMQAITIKPKDFRIYAKPREGAPTFKGFRPPKASRISVAVTPVMPSASSDGQPMYVFYGSNMGSSEGFAKRIAAEASLYGFSSNLNTLDSTTEKLPTDGPIVIVTASFEGEPADNAARFFPWLSSLSGDELVGVKFAVFGCGNHEWPTTYQRIPKLCDDIIEQRGGTRLVQRGVGDAADGTMFDEFEKFKRRLWDTLCKEYHMSISPSSPILSLEMEKDQRSGVLGLDGLTMATIADSYVLSRPGVPVKRHIEIELPQDVTYRCGDYMSILPLNPPRDVQRVLSYFHLTQDQEITLASPGPTTLPTGRPISVYALLSGYVELSQLASQGNLTTLAKHTTSIAAKEYIDNRIAKYRTTITNERTSVLDILELFPHDITIPLSTYLGMLPPMRARQYSISSSPMWNSHRVTLTYSVVDSPPLSSTKSHNFLGVATNYMASLQPGAAILMNVRPSTADYRVMSDLSRPIVMICAGSGFAPMRGFLQERAISRGALGKVLLFFGCRRPDGDLLYTDELTQWVKEGVVDLRSTYSRAKEQSAGCQYVQERLRLDQDEVREAFDQDALFFVCGFQHVVSSVKGTLLDILGQPKDTETSLEHVLVGRYFADVLE